MRYQQYKNKMMKIRKVLDFFYHLRFVFLGIIVVIVAAAITLDVSKGSITETSKFEISYKYGEKISYSGEAFMGNVSFEFRRANTNDEWSEEEPRYVGKYEARAKSLGNHGYKYSDITTFDITPIEATVAIKDDRVNFGPDFKPAITCSLLPGDTLSKDYKVTYDSLVDESTNATVDLTSLQVFDKDNVDVTSCYTFVTEPKLLQYNKEKLVIGFKSPEPFTYDGVTSFSGDEMIEPISGNLWYDAKLVVSGGISVKELGTHKNEHAIKVMSQDETIDYTKNYDIHIDDNSIVVNPAPSITIVSNDLDKVYDGKPFTEDQFTYTIEGLLPMHHEVVTFTNTDNVNYTVNKQNTFNVSIVDDEGNDCKRYYEDVIPTYGSINISKRTVNLQAHSLDTFTFDYKEKEVTGFDWVEAEFAENEHPVLVSNSKPKTPGEHANEQTYKVVHEEIIDEVPVSYETTDNYVINTAPGQIVIKKLPLEFEFKKQDIDYDAKNHTYFTDNNKATITDETLANLPAEWTYSVGLKENLQMKYYNEDGYTADESDVDIHIYAGPIGTNEVTNYFDIDTDPAENTDEDNYDITFKFGTSHINKVPLTITIKDYDTEVGPKEFDDTTLEERMDLAHGLPLLVDHEGLQGDDDLVLDFGLGEDDFDYKTVKDVGTYDVPITYLINDENGDNVGFNYIPTVEKKFSTATITKPHIAIHTPTGDATKKTYDGTNTVPTFKTTDFVINRVTLDEDDNPVEEPWDGLDLKIAFVDANKKYEAASADAGTHSYNCTAADIKLMLDGRDIASNFDIDFYPDGTCQILKRNLNITQKANKDTKSKDYIYYDKDKHGVYNGANAEVEVEPQSGDRGLLNTQTITFGNERTRTAVGYEAFEPEDAETTYNQYFGTVISDELGNDVTKNYNIKYNPDTNGNNSPFTVRIVKKKIAITSPSVTKVFDGSPLDIYEGKNINYDADGYANYLDFNNSNTSFNGKTQKYTVTITGYDGKTETLNSGHILKVTNTDPDILSDTAEAAGTYDNEFDYEIVDGDGNNVEEYYDIKDEYMKYGTLKVNQLKISAYCDYNQKEYDGEDIDNYPGKDAQHPNPLIATDGTRAQGAYISLPKNTTAAPFNKNKFFANFYVKTTFTTDVDYDDYFRARQYHFNATFQLFDKEDNVYNHPSNISITVKSSSYNYTISSIDISITSKTFGTMEMRFISYGKLIEGDQLFFDYGLPTQEEWTYDDKYKTEWNSDFSNITIMRGDKDVTSCYNFI